MKIEDPVERNENPDAVERFYRENYGAIRAPETLREETLRKMLAKQKKLEAGEAPSAETEKRAGKIVTLFGARRSVTRFAAAAAALRPRMGQAGRGFSGYYPFSAPAIMPLISCFEQKI